MYICIYNYIYMYNDYIIKNILIVHHIALIPSPLMAYTNPPKNTSIAFSIELIHV